MQRLAGWPWPRRRVVCGHTASHGFALVETEANRDSTLDVDVSVGVAVGVHGSGIRGGASGAPSTEFYCNIRSC